MIARGAAYNPDMTETAFMRSRIPLRRQASHILLGDPIRVRLGRGIFQAYKRCDT